MLKKDVKKGRGQRPLKIGEEIRHILADMLLRDEIGDPLLSNANVTVTEVRVSPDLKNATVYVLALSLMPETEGEQLEKRPEKLDRKEILEHLNAAVWRFRQVIGGRMRMKFTPNLHFVFDESFDYAARINNLLLKVD
ncbi:MAG: 30S ribosome-binding factor RbfA [Alphaproteobacteria bacterium]